MDRRRFKCVLNNARRGSKQHGSVNDEADREQVGSDDPASGGSERNSRSRRAKGRSRRLASLRECLRLWMLVTELGSQERSKESGGDDSR